MKINYKLLVLIVLIGLVGGCKKDSPIPVPPLNPVSADPDFIFYPVKNARWITKYYYGMPNGMYYFIDTLLLGKDTTILSRTMHPHAVFWTDCDSASLKTYREVIATTMTISPTLDTSYSHYRYGWFRQDVAAKKIFTPKRNIYTNLIYEEISYNFSFGLGDTTDFGYNLYVVRGVDSILFGNRYLKHLLLSLPSSTQITWEIIQCFNLITGSLASEGPIHPGAKEWKKFIYKTDTLTMTY
jgi:hypothetical protein